MFIAQMWAFGTDPQCVGIDGFVTCMGVFLVNNQRLFAIHVPFSSVETTKLGRLAFTEYFFRESPQYQGGAKLYGVVNGNHRAGAEDEVREFQRSLNPEQTTFIRLTSNPNVAAAVVCERVPGTNNVVLKYQTNPNAAWQRGLGSARAGHYNMANPDDRFGVPSTAGWALVNIDIADLKLL